MSEGSKTHPMRIEYYRSTLCAVQGERFVEVVSRSVKAFIVGAVCYVDVW